MYRSKQLWLIRAPRKPRGEAGILSRKNMSNVNVLNLCALDSCSLPASQRCSRCKIIYYCSVTHQKEHWKLHKIGCKFKTSRSSSSDNNNSTIHRSDETTPQLGATPDTSGGASSDDSGEKRTCRCMFCGEELILSSEEEAIAHMGVCPSLQEQFASKDQFTIPKDIKAKLAKQNQQL